MPGETIKKNLFICVEGLFEIGDSIGFDAAHQWRVLNGLFGDKMNVRIFCQRFDQKLHPDVPAESLEALGRGDWQRSDTIVIYHFCDGWPDLEDILLKRHARFIIRWHNNTPPWFFARYGVQFIERTIRGYRSITRLADRTDCMIWCNSNYSIRQLEILGVDPIRLHVIYPASRYLDYDGRNGKVRSAEPMSGLSGGNSAKLLFVGRVVPHKGHRHMLATAACLQDRFGISAEVICPGRIDPVMRDYRDDLLELAERLSVRLTLPEEIVSHELEELYRSADVFLCLSEHEGFGMPIFEAMRAGLPTIALKQTAVAELLADHPLGFEEFEPANFAAAVAALRDADIRDYVLRYQSESILPRYSHDIVTQQILDGLDGLVPPSNARGGSANRPVSIADAKMGQSIKREIERLVVSINGYRPDAMRDIPREISGNFVTLYDLEAYEELTSATKLITLAKAAATDDDEDGSNTIGETKPRDRVGVLIPASRFSTMWGGVPKNEFICPLESDHERLIFGPYLALPKGAYRAEYLIEVLELPDPDRSGELLFDVAGAGQLLSQRSIPLSELREGVFPELEFYQQRPDALLEFRVAVKSQHSGKLKFSGVVLARIASMIELLDRADVYRPADVALPNGHGVTGIAARTRRYLPRLWHKSAGGAFAEADQARDRGDWAIAARLYEKGLKAQPDNFPMWIQYGHALKEAGRLADAEKAYRRAVALFPDDADANLQMGHILKLRGRLAEAIVYYARASQLAPPAGHFAREELVKCGLELYLG